MITQERLKEVLCYDPKTGVFTREGEIVGYDNGDGYLKAYIDNKSYYLHRLAWLYIYGNNAKIIDHKDQNKKNNSISNLREVSNSENLHNRGAPKNSTTGHKGVCFVKSRNKYVAYKTIMYKRKHLGIFDTLEEAVQCRKLFEESL